MAIRRLLRASLLAALLLVTPAWGDEAAAVKNILTGIPGGEHVVFGNITVQGDEAWADAMESSTKMVAYLHRFPFGWRATSIGYEYCWELNASAASDKSSCDVGPWEDIVAVRKLYDVHSFGQTVHVVGDYADGGEGAWESGGEIVFHKVKGKWSILSNARGGAYDEKDLLKFGVPKATIDAWRPASPPPSPPSPSHKPAVKAAAPRLLQPNDLAGKSARELTLMRNEIFARHGRIFHDPELRKYFHAQPWYHEAPTYSDDLLTDVERRNAQFILDYQNQHHLSW